MDSLTQMVLGAGVGEAVLGRKAGNRTILWGAVIATVPDLDVIPAQFMSEVQGMHFHRGFSHSILFFIIASPLIGWLLDKLYRGKLQTSWREWTTFSFLVLLTHALLDCFTSWGTQLLFPLDYHIAWNTIFIVDPLYTIPFLLCIIALMFFKRESNVRRRLVITGLSISSLYLMLTIVNKMIVNSKFEDALAKQGIEYSRYTTKPTPFNSILWFVTAESRDGYHMGHYSLLDKDDNITFQYISKQHELLDSLPASDELETLLHITNGYFRIEQESANKFVLHDLRLGQMMDYKTGTGKFVFSFYIDRVDNDLEITQKPTEREIERDMFVTLWRRMLGQKEFKN